MASSYYTRITLLEQVKYREWTEALGDDREWLVQGTQSELYAVLQEAATKHNAFSIATRYDYMIILSSNLSPEDHIELLKVAKNHSKVEVRMASSCGLTPLEAEARAFKLLAGTEVGGMTYESCPGREASVVAHLDLNNVTNITRSLGVIRAYHRIVELLGRLAKIAENRGGVIQYLGGDNLLVILPVVNYIDLAERFTGEDDLKVGIGVARTARDSLKLATKALHDLRDDRKIRIVTYVSL